MAVASSSKTGNGFTAAPSPTLYVKNIEGKIKKPELRQQLHSLFTPYGRVLDIVSTRAPSMRGQAFVVFENPSSSTAAKRALSGFSFYGKPLVIDFSTGEKSKALLRRELGTEAVLEAELEKSKTTVSRRGEKRELILNQDHQTEEDSETESPQTQDSARKRAKLEQDQSALSVTGVPENIEPQVLETLFSRQQGFLRLTAKDVDEKAETWSARIEFESRQDAVHATQTLQDVQIDPVYRLALQLL